MNRRVLTKDEGLYVGQCIVRDTVSYPNGYHPPCEMRGLKGNQSTWRNRLRRATHREVFAPIRGRGGVGIHAGLVAVGILEQFEQPVDF